MEMDYLIDTNIISAFLKGNQKVRDKILMTDSQQRKMFISGVTYYEIKRGLLAVQAFNKLSNFEALCQLVLVLLIDDLAIFEKATEIYVDLKRRGRPIQDADILIAATAVVHNLIVVSDDSDLQRVGQITIENWLRD